MSLVHHPALMLTINKQTVMSKEIIPSPNPLNVSKFRNKIVVKVGKDTAENVKKNVIMKFQCKSVTHFQDTNT